MIIALLFLILFAILFPKALRFLFALLFIGGIMLFGGTNSLRPAFRYNERSALGVQDAERMAKSVHGIVGKRLTYKDSYSVGG